MNTKSDTENNTLVDYLKWGVTAVLVTAAVVGNSMYGQEPFFYRLLGVLFVGGLAALVASRTEKGRAFISLVKDARTEVKRVVWPTKQETVQTTLIVLVVVSIMAFILWLLDLGLGKLISMIIG